MYNQVDINATEDKSKKEVGKMPMNIGSMLKITNAWNTFKRNHPKFPAFCRAVSRKGIREGSILEISYVPPEGERLETNLKVKAGDLELLSQFMDLSQKK